MKFITKSLSHLSPRVIWTIFIKTREDALACGTYLIFVPLSNDIIYFLLKNNTHLSFPSINNNVSINQRTTQMEGLALNQPAHNTKRK